jgi:exopolyphosphatase/guanosine-5'-triphosphate,3'-diphosphate pyrophosphatase
LFDQSLSLHHLTEQERLLLETASMLHDIGHYINTIDHDRHGYYLLKNHRLIGITPSEQEIIANLVYYHRKQTPAASDENIRSLPQKDRIIVTKLCALLRLADALDTSHLSVIDVILEQQSPANAQYLLSSSEQC